MDYLFNLCTRNDWNQHKWEDNEWLPEEDYLPDGKECFAKSGYGPSNIEYNNDINYKREFYNWSMTQL